MGKPAALFINDCPVSKNTKPTNALSAKCLPTYAKPADSLNPNFAPNPTKIDLRYPKIGFAPNYPSCRALLPFAHPFSPPPKKHFSPTNSPIPHVLTFNPTPPQPVKHPTP